MEILAKIVLFAPLLASAINGLHGNYFTKNFTSTIAIVFNSAAAIAAFVLFKHCAIDQNILHIKLYEWLNVDHFSIIFSIYVDQLTASMFLLVTIVSTVVHIYSLGYMEGDKKLAIFLSFLSLFTFFMLALVSASNFLQLFFGWEGVGFCSYLLIGYYNHKNSANEASIKAFITNRVSDFAFIIGLILIFIYADSLEYAEVFARIDLMMASSLSIFNTEFVALDIICLLLFIGATGKSAQIGLHVWLPDAMEGPTPVSALIHAATMVTAGIFMVVRCSFIFEYSSNILNLIAVIGAVTCLFAAIIAIAQTDIKKIIAYSTCSQLGYMFFACGVSAYQAAMFHLVTHGFFKALLFLSAGSVIHSCHQQDIFKMGGIRTKMPITYMNFWIGSLAIIGVYPFAGFYSKDLILESAYLAGGVGNFAFWLGIIAATLTAIYSLKIIVMVFHGQTKLSEQEFQKVKESPWIMNGPLMILLAGALFAGMIGYYILNIANPNGFFRGSIFNLVTDDDLHHPPTFITLLPMIVGVCGALFGVWVYRSGMNEAFKRHFGLVYLVVKNKFYFDELYQIVIIKPLGILAKITAFIDDKVIDHFGPNACGTTAQFCARLISYLQTGYIFNYSFYIIFAIVTCLTYFIFHIIANGGF